MSCLPEPRAFTKAISSTRGWMWVCMPTGTRELTGPWPHPDKLAQLPKDKFSISRTGPCDQCELDKFDSCHCLSPTTIIVPGTIVQEVANDYFNKLNQCMTANATAAEGQRYPCLSEQVILTQMLLEKPERFNVVGTGEDRMFHDLTSQLFIGGRSDLFDWLHEPESSKIAAALTLAR